MNTFRLLAVLAAAATAFAQPDERRILQDLKKSEPGATGIKFNGPLLETNDGAYYVWSQPVICTTATSLAKKFPNAKAVIYGAVVYYKLTNGSYQFKEFHQREDGYGFIGIPGPSQSEIEKWMGACGGKSALFGATAGQIVNISKFTILPRFWKNYDLADYAVDIETEFDEVWDHRLLTKRVLFALEMRKTGETTWYEGMSPTVVSSDIVKDRKLNADEEKQLLKSGLLLKEAEKAAMAEIQKLPAVDVPAFSSGFQMIAFTHDMLRNPDRDKMKSFLYKTVHPDYFATGMLLTEEGKAFVNSVLETAYNPVLTYGDTYCEDPVADGVMDKPDAAALSFFGKVSSVKAEISVRKVQSAWKIWYVKFALPSKKEMEAIKSSACKADGHKTLKMMSDNAVNKSTESATAWKDFVSEPGQFQIQFPADPTEKLIPSGNLTYYNYVANSTDGAAYSAVAVRTGRTYTAGDAEALTRNFLNSFSSSATILTQKPLADELGGLEAVLDRQTIEVRYRVMVRGEYVYQLYVTSRKGERREANESKFFDSFQTARKEDKAGGKDGKKDRKKKN